jgi:hypothetical protein
MHVGLALDDMAVTPEVHRRARAGTGHDADAVSDDL